MADTTNGVQDNNNDPPGSFGREFEEEFGEYVKKHYEEQFTKTIEDRIKYIVNYYTPKVWTPFGVQAVGTPDPVQIAASALQLGLMLGKKGMPLHPSETVEYVLERYYKDVEIGDV